ncbi:MAG: thioredoxin family protein [Chloroflexi bacterium SZAS-1]|mgnify:CR=1 FL=1|jgi:hypothetical protein|nr:thioredoxin family protein [Chloroflexi bacterium SZAS-1]HNP86336.1 thioredoxin family protein [Kouleothrix sp.]
MLERILILGGLALAVVVGWAALRAWRAWKLRSLRDNAPLADFAPVGRPAIVSFSTPSCAECRTRQSPALTRLGTVLGEAVTIRSLSALEHPELVSQMGILTVPATVVLDRRGVVRHLNLGYTSDQKLREQLAAVG